MSERRSFLVALVIVVVLLLALQAAVRPDPRERNWEIFTEMAYSVAGEPFAAAAVMPRGMELQKPPAGTVVRGQAPFRYGPDEAEALRAGAELSNPFRPEDPGVMERGAELFQTYCLVCHDPAGEGKGPVVLRGMVPPPSFLGAAALEMKDGRIYHLLTLGRGNMASYATQLSPEDRWKVILHVRKLQAQP